MIESALRMLAVVAALLVLASFALFARDKISGASATQQREIVGGVPTLVHVTKRHGQPRRFIDGASKALESPFAHVAASTDSWVDHAVPAVLAVLLYGVGVSFVARYAHGRA